MKTIIVPTDFSENAWNATLYAANLAKHTDARLVLLHTVHIPPAVSESPVILPSIESIAEQQRERLFLQTNLLTTEYRIKVDYVVRFGLLPEVLPAFYQEKCASLVVMGMRGMSPFERILLGSTTASVLKRTTFPVLVVPANVRFTRPNKILFAYDYASLSGTNLLTLLKDLSRQFDAEVKILHVDKEKHLNPGLIHERVESGTHTERLLRGIRHRYIFEHDGNVAEGIESVIKREQPELLVMVPRKRGVLASLINPGNTRRMAFHSHVPLLVLPN
jgi:nucleotide-binding universal stress UspA family protein